MKITAVTVLMNENIIIIMTCKVVSNDFCTDLDAGRIEVQNVLPFFAA